MIKNVYIDTSLHRIKKTNKQQIPKFLRYIIKWLTVDARLIYKSNVKNKSDGQISE